MPRAIGRVLMPLLITAAWLPLPSGCQLFGLVGAMAESAHRQGSTTYPADYSGLEGHSYAVVISADRMIEADHPGITTRLTQLIDRDLHANAGATAHIPPGRLISWLYANPGWQGLTRGELGEQLGVDRLVVVELIEYRLHEPGNRYTWNGVASGIVEVYEIDSSLPDDPIYEHAVAVKFPDKEGMLEEELPRNVVTSELSRRFGQRVAWLFFEHEEKNDLTY
ncbi:MAG TPA: hypothetical protein ENK11_00660 [Phycisphaerales bacterium]|nr:hypothetical protein [Phycisphaerales bacterium]